MASARTTSRARSEPALQLAPLLQTLTAPAALVLDGRLRVVEVSPRARQWLRLDARAGSHAARLPAPVRALARAALKAGPDAEPPRVRFRAPGRGGAQLQAVALPVRWRPAERGVVVVLFDLAETERVEQSLGEIQRLSCVGLLTAGLVHELKNALVPVKTFLDLAGEQPPGAELAGDARRELQRIQALVEQLLRFSRTGRRAAAPVPVHTVLDEALRLVQRRIEERLLSLERRFEAGSDVVEGDAVELQQAFLNLLLNAIEAMGAHGVLTVSTRVEAATPAGRKRAGAALRSGPAARLCVSIQDTGAGIAPENLERVFDPFFTTKPGGTGLGLAIARRIVQEHGGEITVESALNKGTIFRVLLPLAARR